VNVVSSIPHPPVETETARFDRACEGGRWRSLAEVAGVSLAIAWLIWFGARFPDWAGAVIPGYVVASFILRHDSPKTLGMRADNLVPATKNAVIVFGLFSTALVGIGLALHAPLAQPHSFSVRRFFAYMAFCLLQQVAFNSFLTNRLLSVLPRQWAGPTAGVIFAALHWPNPVLVPATLIGGSAMAWLFSRHRNILPLAAGQAVLGELVGWAFPLAWHHMMRVGPAYFLPYHP
jgi:hypothetical protein